VAGRDSPTPLTPALPNVPVDTTLAAVSLGEVDGDAQTAFDLCVSADDRSKVAGMAKMSARSVRRYTRTNGNEPELQDETSVWVVQLRGAVTYRSGVVLNPLCVVKAGQPIIYAPYGGLTREGAVWTPQPDFPGPELALPSLAP
jgi:hypothetical protein